MKSTGACNLDSTKGDDFGSKQTKTKKQVEKESQNVCKMNEIEFDGEKEKMKQTPKNIQTSQLSYFDFLWNC